MGAAVRFTENFIPMFAGTAVRRLAVSPAAGCDAGATRTYNFTLTARHDGPVWPCTGPLIRRGLWAADEVCVDFARLCGWLRCDA